MKTKKIELVKDRFRHILISSGLNNTEFAESVGISKGQVSNILAGERDISEPVAILIEKIYGFRREWTLEGIGPEKNETAAFPLSEQDKLQLTNDIVLSRKITNNPTLKEIAEMLVKIQADDLKKIKAIVETFLK
ncbi:helix-turn-helix domain-containing protein [Leptospira alexanderi]|uniref:helix-turn-helix domain-containing protein n=1 Tax=Leptospira alexanderi TaxID=100053 RepID=UPI002014E3A0|nr:helix-turn-helix transcriptional regulator [Leptospira alexanderi]